jgi:hypothetical protein
MIVSSPSIRVSDSSLVLALGPRPAPASEYCTAPPRGKSAVSLVGRLRIGRGMLLVFHRRIIHCVSLALSW